MPTPAAPGALEGTSLSSQAESLYVALAHDHPCPEDQEEALQELLAYGLVLPHPHPPEPRRYIVRDPMEVAVEKRERLYLRASATMSAASALPEQLRPLTMAYQRAAPQLMRGAVEYVESMEAVNARLSEIIATCTEELLTAQPTGPRSQEVLDLSIPRDLAALARGVAMRTLYRAECRAHGPTAEWVRQVTAAGAHIRTLNEDFLRMIIVDRRVAVVADHTPVLPGQDERRALILHDPGVVLYAARMFDRDWERASAWKGEQRPDSDGLTTQQRLIMQRLVTGAPQSTIAKSLNISGRTVNAEIAALKHMSGSNGLAQLGYWFAQYEAQEA